MSTTDPKIFNLRKGPIQAAELKHKPRSGGMSGLRTVAPGNQYQEMMDRARQGGKPLPEDIKKAGTIIKDNPALPVRSWVEKRTGQHTKTFKGMTGESSANRYTDSVGLGLPTQMEILHGQGYGQVGNRGDHNESNLAAGSHGANTQMIPYDEAMNGHTNVSVTTSHEVFEGTEVAKRVHQSFTHPNYKDGEEPFFQQTIDADRSPVTKDEWEGHTVRAKQLAKYVNQLDLGKQDSSFEETEFTRSTTSTSSSSSSKREQLVGESYSAFGHGESSSSSSRNSSTTSGGMEVEVVSNASSTTSSRQQLVDRNYNAFDNGQSSRSSSSNSSSPRQHRMDTEPAGIGGEGRGEKRKRTASLDAFSEDVELGSKEPLTPTHPQKVRAQSNHHQDALFGRSRQDQTSNQGRR